MADWTSIDEIVNYVTITMHVLMHVMKNCKKPQYLLSKFAGALLGLHLGLFLITVTMMHSEATTSPNNSNERWNPGTDMHVCAYNILALFYKPMQYTSNLPTCFQF